MLSIVKELTRYMSARRKWWLAPIVIVLFLVGGMLVLAQGSAIAPFIYTGIQIVSHRLLRDAPEGPFGTMQLWQRAIAEGRLYGISHTGLWFEVGDPGAIAPTEAWLTRA